jgi:protein SCO1/2
MLLGAAVAACVTGTARQASAHDSIGVVKPAQAVPALEMTSMDGRPVKLDTLLRGKVTALQLMFTGCSATCPISGALFSDLQSRLVQAPSNFQLLSVSIDPLGDDPKALRTWLQRFGARPERWTAALSTTKDLDRLLDFVGGRASGVDRHTAQVYLFDTQARLSYRTTDMPPPVAVSALMGQIAARV